VKTARMAVRVPRNDLELHELGKLIDDLERTLGEVSPFFPSPGRPRRLLVVKEAGDA